MLRLPLTAVLILSCPLSILPADDHSWSLDSLKTSELSVHGDVAAAPGVESNSAVLGGTSLLKVTNIARYGGKALALAATSNDYGRTWTPSDESNLPMATSKPCSGVISNGQRYLICSTTADGGGRRTPLTIAVSKLGENTFSKLFVIRHAVFDEGAGESHPNAALSYPYAIEYKGRLYVGYSNNGERNGNNNSAELAVIPVASLNVK